MRPNKQYHFNMSYLEVFGVLTGVGVDVSKYFGVGSGAGVELEYEKGDSAHLWFAVWCHRIRNSGKVVLITSVYFKFLKDADGVCSPLFELANKLCYHMIHAWVRKYTLLFLHREKLGIYFICIDMLYTCPSPMLLARPGTRRGAIGQLSSPEIFTNVCICYRQQQVTSFCPPWNYHLVAALFLAIQPRIKSAPFLCHALSTSWKTQHANHNGCFFACRDKYSTLYVIFVFNLSGSSCH